MLADQEPLITQTSVLNYAKAGDIISSIEKMKTERGSINYDARTNSLIVRDISRNVDLVGGVIADLDKVTPQVLIEAKIVETTFEQYRKLGIEWTTKVSANAAKRPVIGRLPRIRTKPASI